MGCDSEGEPAMSMEDDDEGETTGEPEPEPEACSPGGGTPTFNVGNGEAGYVDTAELELVYGAQGGYHVVLGMQASFIDASSDLRADISGSIDSEMLASSSSSVVLRCNSSNESLETSGILLIFDAGVMPEDLEGNVVTVGVTLTDASGEVHETSREFMISPP